MRRIIDEQTTLADLVKIALADEPVFISDFEKVMVNQKKQQKVEIELLLLDESLKVFPFFVPSAAPSDEAELNMLKDYISALIYNLLSALGARKVTIKHAEENTWLNKMLHDVVARFHVEQNRAERKGYGRSLNVIERMLANLDRGRTNKESFSFVIVPVKFTETTDGNTASKQNAITGSLKTKDLLTRFKDAATKLEGRLLCGIDIGGTDIKIALSHNDKLVTCMEYDWFPAEFTEAEQILEPVISIVALMRSYLSIYLKTIAYDSTEDADAWFEFKAKMDTIIDQDPSDEQIEQLIEEAEQFIKKNNPDDLILFDAIGLCFPDVVINNKIVGGETYKTRGMRANKDVDYEEEMAKISDLNLHLQKFTREGKVGIVNDGPMAAFTAAVELALSPRAETIKNGIFAHTLGTELGTGWVDENGDIPNIPLEVYNFIIDLGSYPSRKFLPDDPRSVNNFNTAIPGTLQKYGSQSGAFRLAIAAFTQDRPELLQKLFDLNFITKSKGEDKDGLRVVLEPEDMRKAFLQYLMDAVGDKSLDDETHQIYEDVFHEIGRYLAVTWHETTKILAPATDERSMFGRLVKNPACFEQLRKGGLTLAPKQIMTAADDTMALSSLMQQLGQSDKYTIAQFAQAIGAIHYGNQL